MSGSSLVCPVGVRLPADGSRVGLTGPLRNLESDGRQLYAALAKWPCDVSRGTSDASLRSACRYKRRRRETPAGRTRVDMHGAD